MRHGVTIGVVLLLLLAGCNGLPLGQGESSTTSETTILTETSTTVQTTSTPSTQTETSTANIRFSENTETADFLIQTSDLGDGYVLDGETLETASSAGNETAETFADRGILRLHERAYFRVDSNATGPELILASTTVFESSERAATRLDTFTESLAEEGSVKSIEFADGVNAQQVRFRNDRGAHNVVVVTRVDNLVLYVTTSDPDEFYTNRTRDLFLKMYASLQEE